MAIISIYRGDTPTITIIVKDEDGSAVDITSSTLTLSVKENEEDTSYLFQSTGSLSNPTVGEAKFLLTTTNTEQTPATYIYDMQYSLAGDIKTLAKDKFNILTDITRP